MKKELIKIALKVIKAADFNYANGNKAVANALYEVVKMLHNAINAY